MVINNIILFILILVALLLIVACVMGQFYKFLYKFKNFIRVKSDIVMCNKFIMGFALILIVSSFLIGQIINNFKMIGFATWALYILLIMGFINLYITFLDILMNMWHNKMMHSFFMSGNATFSIPKSAVLVPYTLFGVTILWMLLYNVYELSAQNSVYFSMDSDLYMRIGKHQASGKISNAILNLDTNSENFYDEIMAGMDKMFNQHANRYPWMRYMSDANKHKLLCWFSDRLYWCEEYHCNVNNMPFNAEYWTVIGAEMKMMKVNFQTFEPTFEWRHDPVDFDVPTGSATHPRICLKFYQD